MSGEGQLAISQGSRGTMLLLWARRVVFRPLASPRGQPEALPTAGTGRAGVTDPSVDQQSCQVHSVLGRDT